MAQIYFSLHSGTRPDLHQLADDLGLNRLEPMELLEGNANPVTGHERHEETPVEHRMTEDEIRTLGDNYRRTLTSPAYHQAEREILPGHVAVVAKAAQDQLRDVRAAYDEASNRLEHMLISQQAKDQFAKVCQWRDRTRPENNDVLQLLQAAKSEAARAAMRTAQPDDDAWIQALDGLSRVMDEAMAKAYDEADQVYRASRALLIAGAVLALVVGLAAATMITRSILRPLGQFKATLGVAATGDLTAQASVEGKDELAELGRSLNDMLSRLRGPWPR